MENTALNGTATKDHEDWKKKKGYGPIIVAVSLALLLGLSLYMGGHFDDGTNLPPNVAASSSSMSLVGSSTAASDLKTLTIELDDDENIDVLLGWPQKEQRQGGSSAYCKKNTGYNCGAVFPPNGDTCGHKGCCCRDEDGTGMKYNTCDSAKGYAYRGCNSCMGSVACFKTNNINAGTNSCHGHHSCGYVSDSTIDNDSCHGNISCKSVQNSVIHDGSCQGPNTCFGVKYATIGKGSCNAGSDSSSGSCQSMVDNVKIGNNSCHGDDACQYVQNSTIHDGSCQGPNTCFDVKNSIIGTGSCNGGGNGNGYSSCVGSENITIGNNSCNKDPKNKDMVNVCYECKHNVPDNACNQGITDDMDIDGFCNYCL